ncbi:hypothetical protein NliqN6_6057 [Naganishia liquefaciens]|uniref:HSF-type DNA-binding domain-containing protein n=1 Tax=Naganishia liquefaciens TaxID=104408 RepID=A0A8H3TZD2_9TREE|nr:hypothetical protein NliqN6_6057 [Naganishia liquefaciens]
MANIDDFSDLFNMDETRAFDKLGGCRDPDLSPTRPTGIASSSPPPAKNANFLVKLYMALQEETPSTAIYWSVDGKQLVVASPGQLEKEILPKYWKHNKEPRLINFNWIYGFSRVYPGRIFKDENGNVRDDASVWSHPTLHRESTLEQLMAIKRRAAPKLFRTRKLANGQVVQIRAGGRTDANSVAARNCRLDSFSRKAPEQYQHSPYPMMQYTPTFYNSADVRYGQEFAASSQWAFGSQASPAVETSRLVTHNRLGNVTADDPFHYASETMMNPLVRTPAEVKPFASQAPISPTEIIQSIAVTTPHAVPASQNWWLNGGSQPGKQSFNVQGSHTQGMPLLSWTTPSSPTNILPLRDKWNSGSSQTVQGNTGIFQHQLAGNREVFCTAPASPIHSGQPTQTRDKLNIGIGYPATPQDVEIAPADFQFVQAPQEQTYLFSQEEHAIPFSAVEKSFPSFGHTDVAIPATADVYLGTQRRPDTAQPSPQDIWPVNVMGIAIAKPLPFPSYSPEMYGVEEPTALPYVKTHRYTTSIAPPVILSEAQGT